ncbi:hypothetical protein EST38_g7116 [Candolleomyces aberdarensis]|uniref:Uncharacterized protein n=1 Tax=Candolleomyces aberdarensis TaxID=2316362 RepID=A0A4Q2DHZ1_9AGAR|nr:hypothetical protein EST38_g7116 [Candolleomyces aberdarensis]
MCYFSVNLSTIRSQTQFTQYYDFLPREDDAYLHSLCKLQHARYCRPVDGYGFDALEATYMKWCGVFSLGRQRQDPNAPVII